MTLTGGASLEGLVCQWPGYVLVSPEAQGFRSTRVNASLIRHASGHSTLRPPSSNDSGRFQ